MTIVQIVLAGVPRGQGRPRFRAVTTKAGRHFNTAYKDADSQRYEDALRARGQDAMGDRPPLTGPLRLNLFCAFPVPPSWSKKKQREALAGIIRPTVRPDLDNCYKALDALNNIVFVDDSQIVEAIIRKVYSDRPRLEVTIETAVHVVVEEPAGAPAPPLFTLMGG